MFDGCVTDWQVVVPSRKRSGLMPRLLGIFPDAHVYVDEREEAEYAPVVPKGQLFTHPSIDGQQRILAYALERETAEVVLMLDDDLEYVASFVETYPKIKKYTSADDLGRIVSNMANRMVDLDIHWAGWNTSPHPGTFNPTMPTAMTGTIRGGMMIRGRDVVRIDPDIDSFDLDCTLQALLKDRYLLKDMRFFWSFGKTSGNPGGHRAAENSITWSSDRDKLVRKWGKWVLIQDLPVSARMSGGTPGKSESFGHRVNRKATTPG